MRYIIPFSMLIIVIGISLVLWGIQWGIYAITANAMSEDIWTGECELENWKRGGGITEISLSCNGENVEIQDNNFDILWHVFGAMELEEEEDGYIKCTKWSHWRRDNIDWTCIYVYKVDEQGGEDDTA